MKFKVEKTLYLYKKNEFKQYIKKTLNLKQKKIISDEYNYSNLAHSINNIITILITSHFKMHNILNKIH